MIALARRFGPIAEYPFAKEMADYPGITEIIKEPEQTSNFGGMWHTDTAYLPAPPMATLLQAVETPPVGGDTLFASMYAAHYALSDGMQTMLAGLQGVNSSALHAALLRGDHLKTGSMNEERTDPLTAKHPVIRIHPETGRRSLCVNSAHTGAFAGWTPEESTPILSEPRRVYRRGKRPVLVL